jgi:hypothetical protein
VRPRSIIGPVLLIVLGVVFLLSNLRPEFRFFDIAARFWPYLLIGWGGLRLIEVLIWFARGKLTPNCYMRGGEWTLVVFLCLAGSGMFFLARQDWRDGKPAFLRGIEVFGESFDFPVAEQKVAAPAGAFRLILDNQRGNARIVAADGNEIRVSGRKTIKALSRSEAEAGDKASALELISQGGAVLVRTNQERITGDRRISVDLEILLPKAASVEARGRYGDFDITGVNGNVDIGSDNAGVRVQNIGGNVRVETRRSDIVRAVAVKGSVELRGKGQDLELDGIGGPVTITAAYFGDMELRNLAKPLRIDADRNGTLQVECERLPGEIRMDLRNFTGSDIIGPFRLNAKSLDVQLGDVTQSVTISLDRGDVEYRPTKPPVAKADVRTRSGDIEFAAPAGAKFQLQAVANRGDIDNDFGDLFRVEARRQSEDRRDKRRTVTLSGSVGQGPSITLTTDRGVIRLRKSERTAAAAPKASEIKPQPLEVEKQ